jgi:hypothetical protein
MQDGTIYAAALGGSIANRSVPLTTSLPSTFGVTVTAPPTVITVTDSADSPAEAEIKAKSVTSGATVAQPLQQVATASPLTEIPGVDKSAVYKINPDGTVETLWSSKEENVYSLAAPSPATTAGSDSLFFSTDAQGRLYRLGADRKATLIIQTNEGEATRLLQSPDGLFAATGDMGKLFRLSEAAGASGSYESPVHDSGSVARWGRISWRSSGGKVQLATRSGNSARPDKTWSDWSQPLVSAQDSPIQSPNARYIQWRASLDGPGATIENVSLAYLPQNNPPIVRSISVTMQNSLQKSATAGATSSTSAAYSITVTDTGETSTPAGTPTQTLSHGSGSQIQVTWQADDPDGDRLLYSLYFRGEEETQWKLLRANIPENSLLLDGDVLADGRYYFRVIASDLPSNATNVARTDELISSPVLIDNTPPVITLGAPRRSNDGVNDRLELDADVVDQTSPLRRFEYSLDAGPWTPVEAADGVTDSPREQYHIAIEKLRAGEHLLVVRAYDTANNAGLAKVVVR